MAPEGKIWRQLVYLGRKTARVTAKAQIIAVSVVWTGLGGVMSHQLVVKWSLVCAVCAFCFVLFLYSVRAPRNNNAPCSNCVVYGATNRQTKEDNKIFHLCMTIDYVLA